MNGGTAALSDLQCNSVPKAIGMHRGASELVKLHQGRSLVLLTLLTSWWMVGTFFGWCNRRVGAGFESPTWFVSRDEGRSGSEKFEISEYQFFLHVCEQVSYRSQCDVVVL